MIENQIDLLADAVKRAGKTFAMRGGELAYLALTSKLERPFLDRVAYSLHSTLSPTDMFVAREFAIAGAGRADLALVSRASVQIVVEAKAMSGGCAYDGRTGGEYSRLLKRDLKRYKHAPSVRGSSIFSLLVGTFPDAVPENLPAGIVKYLARMRQSLSTHGEREGVQEAARSIFRRLLVDERRMGKIDAGSAFGVHVELIWWLYGPFETPDNLAILRKPAATQSVVAPSAGENK